MPTRVLYWNIRDFALNKIANPNSRKRKRGASLRESEAAIDRYSHILWLINQVNPEIVVVVETETAFDARGRLVRGNGGLGAQTLLGGIRNVMNDNSWMLVPPIQTGPNEAVSVFYVSTQRYFTGPYVWPGGGGATAQAPGGLTGAYPTAWNNRLPNRTIPGGALHNGGGQERRMAARVDGFTYRGGHANAGQGINYNAQRSPSMVSFTETNNNNNVVRDVTLFAIHAPASNAARQYLRDLSDVAQITDAVGNVEVRIVVGDFNWNLLQGGNVRSTSYDVLIGRNYTLAFRGLAVPPNPADGYPWYYGTHLAHTSNASLWSTQNNDEYFPGYGYLSTTDYAIDNIYTRYGNGVNPPMNDRKTIMNAVVGTPYNLVNPPPGITTPIGSIALAIDMENPFVLADPANQYVRGMRKSFQGWEQFGHIYSVSDHMALAIDI